MLSAGLASLDYLKSRVLPDAGSQDTQWDELADILRDAHALVAPKKAARGLDVDS